MICDVFFEKLSKTILLVFVLVVFSPSIADCQEHFVLLPSDMEDYELKVQSKFNWYDSQSQLHQGVQQEWKENSRDQYLYVKYYECKSEFDAIEKTSKLSRSFAGIYVFGSPGGEPTGNLSWTSTDRTAVIFQKWNIGVHITEPFEDPVSAGRTINDVSGKILTKINDSISTEYKVKDTLLRKEQISSDDFEIVVSSSEDTLLKYGFSNYKTEDSKWIFNEDSLVLGMKKQWSAGNSFFSIDIAEFSDNDAAQKAAELNSTVKRTPLSILGDSESIKKAVEEWSLNWNVNDSIKYISVSSWLGNYAIQFYYFDEEGVNVDFFKQVLLCFNSADTSQLEFCDITHIISVDLFESIKTYVLTNGDKETYSNMYNNNPYSSFDGIELYLNPDIGQLNSNCDTSLSDFNEIVIRDIFANPQYYYIHIVRKGDLVDKQIFTYEGMDENKVYLINFETYNMDSIVNNVSKYIEILIKEVTTNIKARNNGSFFNIQIYPNPANETFTIESANPEVAVCQLFNSTGKLLKTLHLENSINTYNISDLKNGIYFIRIPQKETIVVRKLVKN